MIIEFEVPGPAAGKMRPRFARMGTRGVRTYKTAKDKARESTIAAAYKQVAGSRQPHLGPILMDITAIYEPPPSWSKKRRENPGPKLSRPDADNITKSVLDALNGLAWLDDAQVLDVRTRKKYGTASKTVVRIERA